MVSGNTKTQCLRVLISDTLIKSSEVPWTEFSTFFAVSMVTVKRPVLRLLYNLLKAARLKVTARFCASDFALGLKK